MHRLSEEFLSKYKNKQPKWGPLGYITYKRTYARYIEEEDRTEEWWETCRRVIEGNFNIIENDPTFSMEEMERAYDLMFNFAWLPPGRSLWMSGTDFAKKNGSSLVNCWTVAVEPHDGVPSFPFAFAFDQLMLGGGVGFNVQRKYVDKYPPVSNKLSLFPICNPNHKDYEIIKDMLSAYYPNGDDVFFYEVEDSREGWGQALSYVIDLHYDNRYKSLVLDFSKVRPAGERIRGFGGIASGPFALIEMLRDVNEILNSRYGQKMTSVDATDIMDLIGKAVVAGNVRRSALLALGDADDIDFIKMKQDKEKLYHHRWASNNSVAIDSSEVDLDHIVEGITINGEPGIVNLDLARNYGRLVDGRQDGIDANVVGVNPCFTGDMRLLTSEGYKTFAELDGQNVTIVNKDGFLVEGRVWKTGIRKVVEVIVGDKVIRCTPDHVFMLEDGSSSEAINLQGKRLMYYDDVEDNYVSSVVELDGEYDVYDFSEPLTHWGVVEGFVVHNCGEETLEDGEPCNLVEVFPYVCYTLGVDVHEVLRIATRFAKRVTFAPYKWAISQEVVTRNRRFGVSLSGIQDWALVESNLPEKLDAMYKTVRKTDKEYSKALGCSESIKVTTVKPSGSVALLPGVSPGMHWHYSRHFIRRIRFAKNDPLLNVLEKCGYYIEPDHYSKTSMVVEFPVMAPTANLENFRSAEEVSVEEQFAFQAMLQKYWSDTSVSCTITFKKEEIDKIPGLLNEYRDQLKSTSLLPHSDHGYTQAPYEPISEEKYYELLKNIKAEPYDFLVGGNLSEDLNDDLSNCESGFCPVR